MEPWIEEVMRALNRKGDILFGEHAAKDKNLTIQDVDYAVTTIRIGKIEESKSTEGSKRICFKNYFSEEGETYFVVIQCYPDFMKVVTVMKKKGKY